MDVLHEYWKLDVKAWHRCSPEGEGELWKFWKNTCSIEWKCTGSLLLKKKLQHAAKLPSQLSAPGSPWFTRAPRDVSGSLRNLEFPCAPTGAGKYGHVNSFPASAAFPSSFAKQIRDLARGLAQLSFYYIAVASEIYVIHHDNRAALCETSWHFITGVWVPSGRGARGTVKHFLVFVMIFR